MGGQAVGQPWPFGELLQKKSLKGAGGGGDQC